MRSRRSIDLEIAALADRQWGVVERAQLLALGLSASGVDRRVWSERLRVIHRGVYAVGHRVLRPQAYRLAAVLACGPGAVLSYGWAAAHWGLRPTAATRIDVTVPGASQRRRPGIRIHRHSALLAQERGPRGLPGHHSRPDAPRPGRQLPAPDPGARPRRGRAP